MASTERLTRYALASFAASLVLLAGAFFLAPVTLGVMVFGIAIGLSFTVVGTLIALRRPENPVGWLILGFGTVASLAVFSDQYFLRGAIIAPGSLPATDFVVSLGIHTWHPGFALFILAFFLFPDGTLLSPRWRVPAAVTVALGITGVAFGMLEFEFQRTWDPEIGAAMNPLFDGPLRAIGDVVFGFSVVAIVAMFVVSAAALLLRLKRSSGAVRAQTKWVVFAIVMTVAALVTSLFLFGNGALGALMLPSIPISMAVAVLRYKLFDIDQLIRRTLVYAVATAILAAIYSTIVVVGGTLVAAEGGAPPTLIAAATLVLAMLFRPVRDRLQGLVDRRFNRRRYDAARTIQAFAGRLRDELDLDALATSLVATVDDTMEPTHVSLWLRPPLGARSAAETRASASRH